VITTDRVIDYTGASGAQVALLPDLVGYAIAYLEGETHRYFRESREFTEYLFGTGTVRLWLREPPVESYEDEVIVDARRMGSAWEEVIDFEVRGRSLIRDLGVAWDRREEYRVTYTSGYVEDGLPPDVEEAVLELVRYRLRDLSQTAGLQSERLGDYQYTLGAMREEPWFPMFNRVVQRWMVNPT
jgi:hypothetical protein